jgi:hypothetical protein
MHRIPSLIAGGFRLLADPEACPLGEKSTVDLMAAVALLIAGAEAEDRLQQPLDERRRRLD